MRICEVIASKKYKRILITIAEKQGAIDYWWSSELEDGRQIFTMVVADDTRQSLIDSLQVLFEEDKQAKILILPVDASLPRLQESKNTNEEIKSKTTREELFEQVSKGVNFNINYVFMVILSSIVATIGLSEDNIVSISWSYGYRSTPWSKSCSIICCYNRIKKTYIYILKILANRYSTNFMYNIYNLFFLQK